MQAKKKVYFKENVVLNWFIQVTMAVKHIHSRNILHRDLKVRHCCDSSRSALVIAIASNNCEAGYSAHYITFSPLWLFDVCPTVSERLPDIPR